MVKHCVDVFLRNDLKAYAETCTMLGSCDLRPALAAFKMPTAVVVGEEDYATPVAMAQTLHNGIAGSTLTVLKGARHLTPLERPDIHRCRARSAAAGASRFMKFTGELIVKAPRAEVFEAIRDARFFASCVDGVRDLAEIAPDRYSAVFETKVAYMKFTFKVTVEVDARRAAARDRGQGRGHAARRGRAA